MADSEIAKIWAAIFRQQMPIFGEAAGDLMENADEIPDTISNIGDTTGNVFSALGKGINTLADNLPQLIRGFIEDPATYWDYFRNGKANEFNLTQTRETNEANKAMTESTNQSNIDIANSTNEINKQIADENLGYQRDLFEYNKALQDKLFEREDTSYQRTAQDMIAAGLNPLSMQGTNGAGGVVSQTAPQNTHVQQMPYQQIAPQFEKFQMQAAGIDSIINTINSVANSVSDLFTGKKSRDLLTMQTDKQKLENLITAHANGYIFDKDSNEKYTGWKYSDVGLMNDTLGYKVKGDWSRNMNDYREYNHKTMSDIYDTDLREERILTALEDWVTNGRMEKLFNNFTDSGQKLLGKLLSK